MIERGPRDRRQAVTEYVRSCRRREDRRTDEERRKDNHKVADWISKLDKLRRAT